MQLVMHTRFSQTVVLAPSRSRQSGASYVGTLRAAGRAVGEGVVIGRGVDVVDGIAVEGQVLRILGLALLLLLIAILPG